ncbi:hypothetical protein [Lelliottia wanjuensis]|uniref:hypothetical protein n=1 Tax=Lelliottia wanjuensis TaxID=3050585 RepID=UPI00254B8623|nr:hypothetical protein [Lelliottia sp. V86_10]MDK9585437.1 hypothetical protein [Lelliottia sp. V86_10]
MTAKLTDLLDKQADVLTALTKGHAGQIEGILAAHRFKIVQLVLHESPEPFVREIFDRLRDDLRSTAHEQSGLADGEDARCLLRILDRMQIAALEGKPL